MAKQVGRSTESDDSYEYTSFTAAYGITDTFAVGASLPFARLADVRTANIVTTATSETKGFISNLGSPQGLSDLVLFGQWQIFNNKEHKLAGMLSFGTYAPTGASHVRADNGDLFAPDDQPGRGSFAPFAGLIFTREITDGSISFNFYYTKCLEGAQNAKSGDIYDYNLGLVHTLYQTKSNYYLYGILELNGEYYPKTIQNGLADPDTGANVISFTTALRLSTPGSYYPFIALSVPILQSANGIQSTIHYDIACGLDIITG